MCDIDHLAEMAKGPGKGLNRRQFTAIGAVAGLAACAPMDAGTAAPAGLRESMVSFPAPGGTMDAYFVHPGTGKHPAVIIWPDIAGLRDAFKLMARDLASAGFAVLVLNPFYRSLPAPQFADFEDFRANDGFQKVGPWRAELTAEKVMETARAVVGWLDRQGAVDTTKGIGNQGYCMGGPLTVWTAVAVPTRIKAAASFHGGGLVSDDATAPIKLLGRTNAHFLFAIAKNDDARTPAEKDQLRAAVTAAGKQAEIEVYDGDHGWTVADSPAYAEAAAKRAWGRLLALYRSAL